MKRLAIVFGVLCLGVFAMFIENNKKKKNKNISYENDDVEFTGPHGEKILVGNSGGRYYLKGDKKVYIKRKK